MEQLLEADFSRHLAAIREAHHKELRKTKEVAFETAKGLVERKLQAKCEALVAIQGLKDKLEEQSYIFLEGKDKLVRSNEELKEKLGETSYLLKDQEETHGEMVASMGQDIHFLTKRLEHEEMLSCSLASDKEALEVKISISDARLESSEKERLALVGCVKGLFGEIEGLKGEIEELNGGEKDVWRHRACTSVFALTRLLICDGLSIFTIIASWEIW